MGGKQTNLTELSKQVQQTYERNAHKWAEQRPKSLLEKTWLDKFLALAPKEGKILDLGCGSGDPIARYIFECGRQIIGVDASNEMIKLAKTNFPSVDWQIQDMRKLDLPHTFAGIIGWNSFFHLTRDEQRNLLPCLAGYLLPGGALLLTVGPSESEVAGMVGNDPIYHASLSPTEYENILATNGLTVVEFTPEDPLCFGMTLLLAQKNA